MLTRELLARLPKAELHTHLDSALRPATMVELAREAKFALPTTDPDALRRFMVVSDAGSLEDYLARFEYTIPLLQTPEAVERVAYEMVEDAARDNIRYLEVRYCPHLSQRQGMTLDEVMEAELQGLARGERDFGVVARVINCSLRHYDPAVSVEIAECSVAFRHQGVVAFDLAGGEAGRPPGNHRAAFDVAAQGLLGVTVHAGEAAGAQSIADAVQLCHADRIGHGTRLYESPDLQAYIRDRQILIEANITSNVQTRAVSRASEHPVRGYFDAGLNVTLCTDGWLMAGVSLSDEYWLAHEQLGFNRAEIDRMILNAFEGAFLPLPERLELLSRARDELADIR
ncbi:MAG TPA: adenosine deaminase [Gemmatimonadales bacterium]|nr:adenosine deaminase [Gemmatimonadales bacterium]